MPEDGDIRIVGGTIERWEVLGEHDSVWDVDSVHINRDASMRRWRISTSGSTTN
jgi:hypothetical protein